MRDDEAGWSAAEVSEISNHESMGSWDVLDRSDMPSGRNLVKLIWAYKRKRSGKLKARLCVQGCAQVAGIDYDQTWCGTMRPASLRALSSIASEKNMKMHRWDFVAAFLKYGKDTGVFQNTERYGKIRKKYRRVEKLPAVFLETGEIQRNTERYGEIRVKIQRTGKIR
jgi:hypothetical protein